MWPVCWDERLEMAVRLSDDEREKLKEIAYHIRRLTVEMVTWARWGHIGGSFSMAEILAVLYFRVMTVRPAEPNWEGRDRLILSKAHASPALYATLALRGYLPIDELYTYCELGSRLEGHADLTRTPGLDASGGPLGMGLSVAVGRALALRQKHDLRARVFCILGDGECNEGNVWEAAMAASHYRLDNLIAVVDYNKVMAKGATQELMGLEPFAAKWRAFGWEALEVDGHDVDELANAFHNARWLMPHGAPIVVIAHTVKGRGVQMAEFNPKWHTHAPDAATADAMLRELSKTYGQTEQGYSRLDWPATKETFYGGE
jgi:transketolase